MKKVNNKKYLIGSIAVMLSMIPVKIAGNSITYSYHKAEFIKEKTELYQSQNAADNLISCIKGDSSKISSCQKFIKDMNEGQAIQDFDEMGFLDKNRFNNDYQADLLGINILLLFTYSLIAMFIVFMYLSSKHSYSKELEKVKNDLHTKIKNLITKLENPNALPASELEIHQLDLQELLHINSNDNQLKQLIYDYSNVIENAKLSNEDNN